MKRQMELSFLLGWMQPQEWSNAKLLVWLAFWGIPSMVLLLALIPGTPVQFFVLDHLPFGPGGLIGKLVVGVVGLCLLALAGVKSFQLLLPVMLEHPREHTLWRAMLGMVVFAMLIFGVYKITPGFESSDEENPIGLVFLMLLVWWVVRAVQMMAFFLGPDEDESPLTCHSRGGSRRKPDV